MSSAECDLIAVCRVVRYVDRAAWFCVNRVSRAGCVAVQRNLSGGVFGFDHLLRASFVASHVLRDLVAAFARLSQDHLGVLFNRYYQGVDEGRFMLHRRVQFRPSAREVVLSRRVDVACPLCALSFEGRIGVDVIFGRLSVVQINFVVR